MYEKHLVLLTPSPLTSSALVIEQGPSALTSSPPLKYSRLSSSRNDEEEMEDTKPKAERPSYLLTTTEEEPKNSGLEGEDD
ncbi:hypothetical protein NADE_002189 [Nannochloris sp. 'desiccata']|nr:hypothetical protein NADE_002189 [Chlorella desiccata (nom. nud.)]